MMKVIVLFKVLIFVSVSVAFASTNGELKKKYSIGVEDLDYYPLWKYHKQSKEYVGMGRELLDAFAADLGITFEYKPYPIKRLLRQLTGGNVDFKFPDSNYWALDAKGDAKIIYSDSVIKFIDGVFVMPDKINFKDDDVSSIATVLGFTPWDWLDRIKSGKVGLKETPNIEALISQGLNGRVDGIYVNTTILNYHLETSHRSGQLLFNDKLSHVKGDYLMSTIKHPGLIKKFNKWLLSNEELLSDLKEKYNVKL